MVGIERVTSLETRSARERRRELSQIAFRSYVNDGPLVLSSHEWLVDPVAASDEHAITTEALVDFSDAQIDEAIQAGYITPLILSNRQRAAYESRHHLG